MGKETIKCNVAKLFKQILITISLICLVITLLYFEILERKQYRMIWIGGIAFALYLLFKDLELLWNYKKTVIEIDSEGYIDYDSIYGKVYWSNIESIVAVDVYSFFFLYKEPKVIVYLKNKRSTISHLKNKKLIEKTLENNSININTTKIDISATDLRDKLLKYKK